MGFFQRLFGGWRRRSGRTSRNEPAVRRPHVASGRQGGPQARRSSDAFTPTRPKLGRQLVGREIELSQIMQAISEERAHVVLYSERGRGKTSLANLVTESMRRQGHVVARYTCEASSTFDTVVRGLVRDLPAALLAVPAEGGVHGEGCEAALPAEALRPRDVATLPSRLSCRHLVCVIDEFDRIEDSTTRTRFADTIKQVSDRGIRLSFVIVGVSENLEQILGQHPSIQRNITAIHLPLLSDAEIAAMLTKGGRDCGLIFAPDVVAHVSVIARGMPHMAQVLGLRIAQSALGRGDDTANQVDFAASVDRLIADARHNVVEQYARLTNSGQDHEMVTALRRLATAEQDRWGRLALTETANGVLIGGRDIPRALWAALRAENVLRTTAESETLLAFADRALMYHTLLLAAQASVHTATAARAVPAVDPKPTRPTLAAWNG